MYYQRSFFVTYSVFKYEREPAAEKAEREKEAKLEKAKLLLEIKKNQVRFIFYFLLGSTDCKTTSRSKNNHG